MNSWNIFSVLKLRYLLAGLGGLLAILKESKIKSIKEDLKINNSTNILFINSEGDTDKEVFSEIINSNI